MDSRYVLAYQFCAPSQWSSWVGRPAGCLADDASGGGAALAANERRGPAKVAQRPERSRSQAATMRLEGIATGSRGAGAAEATKAQTFRSFSAVWVSVVRATHASSSAVKVFSAAVWIINAGAELERRSLFSR